jgi:hypothetical protein
MVMNRTISIGCCLLLWFAVSSCAAQTIPAVNAVALDGSRVVLPNPGAQQVLILTLGFSHSSADGCESWNKRIAADYGADARVAYYQIPNLEGAPGIVIPMILHGMRRNVPAAAHAHFVPVYDHEAEWKKLVNFSGADDAYVVVATADGRVVWQGHGRWTEAGYGELRRSVEGLVVGKR